jgi:hypothetical protein
MDMKILHITPETNGYEEATLLANAINKKNHFRAIEKDGEVFMTGGIILKDTLQIRGILDLLPRERQYQMVRDLRETPFVKEYLED